MKQNERLRTGFLPALFFLLGFSLSLHSLSPFPGWGESPALALASATLKRASFFGFPVLETLSHLLSRAIPFQNNVFAMNLSGPILFGLTLSFIFFIARKLSDCWLVASCVTIATILEFPIFTVFSSISPASMSVFLLICLLLSFILFSTSGSVRVFYALLAIAGVSIFHSGANVILVISILILTFLNSKSLLSKPASFWSPLSFVFILFSSLLVFVFLRPPLIVDFSTSLPAWLGVLSPFDDIASRIVRFAPLRDMLSNLLQVAKIILSASSLFFLAWLAAAFFKSSNTKIKYLSLLPVPFLLLSLLSIKESSFFNNYIFVLFFIVLGAPVLLKQTQENSSIQNKALPVISIITILPLFYSAFAPTIKTNYFPDKRKAQEYLRTIPRDEIVFSGNEEVTYTEAYLVSSNASKRKDITWRGNKLRPKLFTIKAYGSDDYFHAFLKGFRRDAILVADPNPDNLHAISFYRDFYGIRKDIDVLYSEWILNKEYREYMWKREYPMAKIPDREEYAKLIGQVATMTRQPGMITGSNKVRERIVQGMTDLLNDAVLIQNSNFRPVYYNRIDNIINSQMYQLMYFDPAAYSFRLLMYKPKPFEFERFIDMATSNVTSDSVGKEIVATYFRNIGEHFYSQDKPISAVPFLETCASLNPDDISCRFFLGLIYKSWGKYDSAEMNFTKALKNINAKKQAGGQDSGDILMLARIYRELGRNTEAQKYEKMVEPGALSAPPPTQ